MNSHTSYKSILARKGKALRKHSRREINKANRIISFGRQVISSGHYDDTSSYKKVLMFLTVKSYKSYRALKILCQRGYGQDAKM